jgi:hypothetical protein
VLAVLTTEGATRTRGMLRNWRPCNRLSVSVPWSAFMGRRTGQILNFKNLRKLITHPRGKEKTTLIGRLQIGHSFKY